MKKVRSISKIPKFTQSATTHLAQKIAVSHSNEHQYFFAGNVGQSSIGVYFMRCFLPEFYEIFTRLFCVQSMNFTLAYVQGRRYISEAGNTTNLPN